jgi:HSP20 family protein
MAMRRSTSDFWQDYEDIMTEMRRRFNAMLRGYGPSLPAAGGEQQQLLPVTRGGGISTDVKEQDDAVIVTVDLPGVEKQDIHVQLLDPQTLQISTERKEERKEEKEGYYLHERRYGAMTRSIPLPVEVTEQDVATSFRNGVLEIRLKKSPEARRKEIPIE